MSLVTAVRPRCISLALGLLVLAPLALPGSTDAASFNEVKKLLASDAEAEDRFGVSVAVSGDIAVVGAWGEGTGGFRAGAAYVFERNNGGADDWGEVKKLTASDARGDNSFGWSVAASIDTVVVGAPYDVVYAQTLEDGEVYVFQRNQGGADNWGEVKKLTASDAQPGKEFGDGFGWSVAVSGDTVIVGARLDNEGGGHTGAVYVFERNKGGVDNWGEVKKLLASDSQNFVQFGWRVALSGDTAIVGAPFRVAGGIFQAGAAFLFERNEGGADNWGEVKRLTASDAQEHDWFGFDVAVSGDTAIVGAQREDATATDAGAAYVFERNQGGADNWGEVTKVTASDAEADDNFGFTVSVSGDSAVVGSPKEGTGGDATGAAYIFQRNEGGADNWGEVKKLTASDAEAGDVFGISVGISASTSVVGAWHEDAGGSDAGAAYVFQQPPSPVGGISLDSGLQPLALEATKSSSAPWAFVAGIAGAAGLFALGGAAWYARRRRAG